MSRNARLYRGGRWLSNRPPIGGRLSYAQEGEGLVLARLYRPKVVLVELLNAGIEDFPGNSIARLLHNFGCQIYSKTCNTFFFAVKDAADQWKAGSI